MSIDEFLRLTTLDNNYRADMKNLNEAQILKIQEGKDICIEDPKLLES